MRMTKWRATFKARANVTDADRRTWTGHDLEVEVPAVDREDARARAAEVARQYLADPWLGELEPVPAAPAPAPKAKRNGRRKR